jgi:2-methylcitrate dehydratase PrpD
MRGGEILRAEMMYPKGDPGNPLSNDELAQKFRDNARDYLSGDDLEKFISGAMNLGAATTLAELTRPLRARS